VDAAVVAVVGSVVEVDGIELILEMIVAGMFRFHVLVLSLSLKLVWRYSRMDCEIVYTFKRGNKVVAHCWLFVMQIENRRNVTSVGIFETVD
jgi:hypothetical protein